MELTDVFAAALADQRAGRLADAERGYRALLAEALHLPALKNLALILSATGRHDEAGRIYCVAADAAPDDPATQEALANHLRETRQLARAEAAYRRVLDLDPTHQAAATSLGYVLLAMGRLQEGWAAYAQRQTRRELLAAGLSFPEWEGQPLAGKRLLVRREQGFGDQIMMARFFAGLSAAEVTYAGPPALERLFSQLPVRFLATRPQGQPIAPHDYWTLSLSLPHRLGVTRETLPTAPYLRGRATDAGGRIGVIWRGEPTNLNDRFRSLPPALGAELLALPGAVSLDPADSGAVDLQATADLIAGLDLVITVDTAVAHLAGAMGAPVWVMLARHALDWQWPREGRSPWYPQARLFVQPTAGDWASVVSAVSAEVKRLGRLKQRSS